MLTLFIASFSIAIIFSFLCSLAEAVLLSLNPIRLETLKGQGRTFAIAWLRMKENIGRPIAAILILNTVAHTGGATISGGAFDEIWGNEWLWAYSVIFTLIILFFTEIIPKVLGVRFNEQIAPWLTPVIQTSMFLLQPIIYITEKISNLIKGKEGHASVSLADISTMAKVAMSYKLIDKEQETIILNAAKLRETRVQSIMIPKDWIVFLKTGESMKTNFDMARNNFHTRYPVSETDSVDGIIGYVNFKEMAAAAVKEHEFDLEQFLRPVLYVSPDTNLNTMIKLFIAKHHHFALVKDSKGKIIGMVTLEDVLEEIVGDIQDEFDIGNWEIVQVGSQSWRVGGDVRCETLQQRIGFPFEKLNTTLSLSEWMKSNSKSRLNPGNILELKEWKFTVLQIKKDKIFQIYIEKLEKPS